MDLLSTAKSYRSKLNEVGSGITLIFVANLFDGTKTDIDPYGVSRTAQFYSSVQISEIQDAFLNIGVNFIAILDEKEFIKRAINGEFSASDHRFIVFACAEGGAGAGKRSLIPAFCQLMQLPCFPSGPHASSMARHKFHANAVLKKIGVRVPETWMYFGNGRWAGHHKPPNAETVILKPTYESNSIGIDDNSVLEIGDNFQDEIDRRYISYKQPVIVQQFVSGYEIAAPIIQVSGRALALPCVGFKTGAEDRMANNNRTFLDECVDFNVRYFTDIRISPQVLSRLQDEAKASFEALEMSTFGRFDARIDEDGRSWIFDTNESPPPLDNTSYLTSLKTLGLTYHDMLALWLGSALEERKIHSAFCEN